MSQVVEIIVDAKGEARVETKGFTGPSCRRASDFVAKALGRIAHEQLKPEYLSDTAAVDAVARLTD